jgi:hypothetical protein
MLLPSLGARDLRRFGASVGSSWSSFVSLKPINKIENKLSVGGVKPE